jgi:hypothetical protein
LTDYYAPVENLLATVVRQSVKDALASEYFDRAERLAKLGKFEESVDCFSQAAKAKPLLRPSAWSSPKVPEASALVQLVPSHSQVSW